MKKPALGRGLDALIGKKEEGGLAPEQPLKMISIDEIRVSDYQPRKGFSGERLKELKDSIVEKGVLQPILVRKAADGYYLIAGERRLRAAKEAGLSRIPAVVRKVEEDGEHLELSLVENIQREDLNPIETARGYRRLGEEFGLTQDEIARRVGKDRSTVANTLRLLELDEDLQDMVSAGLISFGQAKVLLSIPDSEKRREYASLIRENPVTVRQLESMVGRDRKKTTPRKPKQKDVHLRDVEFRLREALQTRVNLKEKRGGGGVIEIEYYNPGDRERLIDRLL